MPKVDTQRKEYTDNYQKWCLVEIFVEEKTTEYPTLLRKIESEPDPVAGNKRNKEYQKSAVMTNVVKRSHDGMLGAVYRKKPVYELPASVDYLETDANGLNMSIEQFSKKIVSHTMQTGRDGILVDIQADDGGETVAETRNKKAVFIEYESKQIINWKVENGKLVLVVLCEEVETTDDGFEYNTIKQYRVLRLVGGAYIQQIYQEKTDDVVLISEAIVTDYAGNSVDEITFSFVGTVNNDTEIDPSLLYSIAELNRGHYQNSADLEENCFVHGQLTLGISSSLDPDSWNDMNPNGVQVGARRGYYLGEGGGFHSVQAQPNQLADTLMARKEKQMMSIGARMISDTGGNEREVSVLSRIGAESATLSSLVDNVSDAMNKCIQWANMYMSPTEAESRFELNKDFYPQNLDPAQVMGLIQLYDRGRIAGQDLHENLQKASIVSDQRTLDDIEAENDNRDPMQTTVMPFNG